MKTRLKIILFNILLIVVFLILTSFNWHTCNDARNFHVSVTNEETVVKFEQKFPQLVEDRAVYIAYLFKYIKGNEENYVKLLN